MSATAPTTFCMAIESIVPDEITLVSALMSWSRAVRCAPGHISFSVSDEDETPGLFVVHSEWASAVDLEMHLAGTAFGDVLATCQMLRRRVLLRAGGRGARGEHPEALLRRVRGHAPRLDWLLVPRHSPTEAPCAMPWGRTA